MIRYPHRIRLRGPRECEPLNDSGRVRFRRRFGYPGRIDDFERVWITGDGVAGRAVVRLNSADLGGTGGDAFAFEVTRLLRPRNELILDVEGAAEQGGLRGEIALEVRCRAFLRDVKVWVDGDHLLATGLVVGEADRPLDLYVLLDGSTVAYTTVPAAPAGAPFRIIAERPGAPVRETGQAPVAQVDLVNGAVVWYTTALELTATTGRTTADG